MVARLLYLSKRVRLECLLAVTFPNDESAQGRGGGRMQTRQSSEVPQDAFGYYQTLPISYYT